MAKQLSTAQVMEVWEQASALWPAQRAVALASLLEDSPDHAAIAGLPIGQRDAKVMALRKHLFGEFMDCTAKCPGCGHAVEFSLSVTEILREHQAGEKVLHTRLAECEVTAHLPTSLDVMEAGKSESAEEAKTVLLQRCILTSRRQGVSVPVKELPEDVVAEVMRLMEEMDPLSVFRLTLDCPDCARRWEAPFDIVGFLWNEIQCWALRLLQEVHVLARAYGWREEEILALNPARRRMYLEMVAG